MNHRQANLSLVDAWTSLAYSLVGEPWLEKHKLFGSRRVDCNRVIEVLFRCAHSDCNRDTLDHLINALAKTNDANDLQVGPVGAVVFSRLLADDLEETLLFVLLFSRRVEHVREFRFEDMHALLSKFTNGGLL